MSPVCCGSLPPLPPDQAAAPLSHSPQFVQVISPELLPFAVKPTLRLWNA